MEARLFGDDRAFPSGDLPRGALLARVAVERGVERAGAPDAALTYAVPPELAPDLRRGDRVTAPLGKAGKEVAGVVVALGHEELLQGLNPSRLRPLAARSGDALPESLIDLALWMSRYYVCPLGMTLASMTPAAVKRRVGSRQRVTLQLLAEADRAPILEANRLTPKAREAYDAAVAHYQAHPSAAPTARELARMLGLASIGPINRLLALGLLTERTIDVVRSRVAAPMFDEAPSAAPTPNTAQAEAIAGVVASFGSFSPHLLFGVTGSGKTEVYLGALEALAHLDRNAGAIVLVPEIGLTPQTSARFRARLGDDRVAVLHSGLSAAERHRQWARLADGSARIAVGARSAVFAPVDRLGLVIVDEEHDPSYKQDQLPRYHARDVAVKRAQLESCPVLLGSATPSLESWSNAVRAPEDHAPPRYRLWRLPERAGGATLPAVRIVDISAELRDLARRPEPSPWPLRDRTIGPTLEAETARVLSTPGEQAILLLNRRGHAGRLACPDQACGYVHRCDHCDAAMVTHRAPDIRAGRRLRCHHCLAEQGVPKACPLCARPLQAQRPGTQRVEEELEALFGERFGLRSGEGLLRLDADAAHNAAALTQTLDTFARGDARILLGTQMIAKGLDFAGVRLVGVISADTALAIPDFRADERTFQLVAQVAGRAGRRGEPGRVIVQTQDPTSPAITLAAQHDFESFAQTERSIRRTAGLPPSRRLARIIIRNTHPEKAADRARAAAEGIRAGAHPSVSVQGPLPCVVARVADHYRFAIDVFADRATDIQAALAHARTHAGLRSDAETAIDVDPVTLL
ncbi:MAG: primosomal protein N' [Planctomycetota bacterium]